MGWRAGGLASSRGLCLPAPALALKQSAAPRLPASASTCCGRRGGCHQRSSKHKDEGGQHHFSSPLWLWEVGLIN